MFNFSSAFADFRALIARLQAEQDARAAQIVADNSEQTLIVRRGDDVTGGEDGIVRITPGDDGPVVDGDVPDNAVLQVGPNRDALAPVAEEVVEPAPVVEEAPEAPVSTVSNNIIRITPGENGPVVEGDVPDNAELTIGEGVGDLGRPTESNVIITGGTQQIDRNPAPAAEPEQTIEGTEGRDFLFGGTGDDVINGNGGRDRLTGGEGDDILAGGTGRDVLDGGQGNDTFVFNEGDGFDDIRNFDLQGDDVLQINIDGIDSVDDFLGALTSTQNAGQAENATFDFGNGDRLNITLDAVENLTAEDFIFG